MSHLYPLAETAAEALSSPEPAARTRADAERLAGATEVLRLETEWLTPGEDQAAEMAGEAAAVFGLGFVQTYEDETGAPVYAVTYWKLAGPIVADAPAEPAKTPKAKAARPPSKKTGEDDTDDLYFKGGRTRRRKRKRYVDQRQLDLFVQADTRGYERRDPSNPDIILTDEEGDGTTFGG